MYNQSMPLFNLNQTGFNYQFFNTHRNEADKPISNYPGPYDRM